jgi:hypothetical protein
MCSPKSTSFLDEPAPGTENVFASSESWIRVKGEKLAILIFDHNSVAPNEIVEGKNCIQLSQLIIFAIFAFLEFANVSMMGALFAECHYYCK